MLFLVSYRCTFLFDLQVMQAKRDEPNKFASFWEMDEDDIDEATEEEILSMCLSKLTELISMEISQS